MDAREPLVGLLYCILRKFACLLSVQHVTTNVFADVKTTTTQIICTIIFYYFLIEIVNIINHIYKCCAAYKPSLKNTVVHGSMQHTVSTNVNGATDVFGISNAFV